MQKEKEKEEQHRLKKMVEIQLGTIKRNIEM